MTLYKLMNGSSESIYRDKTTKQPKDIIDAENYFRCGIHGCDLDCQSKTDCCIELNSLDEAILHFNLEENQ